MFQEIRSLEPQRVVYVDRRFHEENAEGGPQGCWHALEKYVEANNLMGRTTYGVGTMLDRMDTTPQEEIRYRAAYMIPDSDPLPTGDGVHEGQTEAGRYAVFLHQGSFDGLADAWGRVMGEAFPATGLAMRDAPMFEIYLDDSRATPESQLRTEIFIPVE